MSQLFTEEFLVETAFLCSKNKFIDVYSGSAELDDVDIMDKYVINSLKDVNLTVFSNSYKTKFTVDGIEFNSIDQYFAYKAVEFKENDIMLFRKKDLLEKIINDDFSGYVRMSLSSLKVSDSFLEKADDILYMGLVHKFANENLRLSLMFTDNLFINIKNDYIYDNLLLNKITHPKFEILNNRTGILLMVLRQFI